jgi:hypothetical protein
VRVPRLLDAGEEWLLLEAVEVADRDGTAWRDAALADLARLHESFAEKPVLDDPRLRSVIAAELARLTERGVALADELELPAPLRVLLADLEPLLAEVRGWRTLVHGDAWPGNVLPRSDGGLCWIDWEEAGAGHPALDLATWLHGSPWVPPADDPERDLAVYLDARTDGVSELASAGPSKRPSSFFSSSSTCPAWQTRIPTLAERSSSDELRRRNDSAPRTLARASVPESPLREG